MIFYREIGEWFKGPEHFDCSAQLADLRRMQRFRYAEQREANQGDAACLERLKRTSAEDCASELENLRRMQRTRANEPVAELGEGVSVGSSSSALVPGLGGDHFDCASELEVLRRMQRLCEFRFDSAELLDLRRMQRLRDA